MKKIKISGFTLIELILVIGILAVLFTAVIATLNPITQFQKANDARRKSDLSQIQKALENYYQDNGRYPQSKTTSPYCIEDSFLPNTDHCWGASWTPYINILPKDPVTSKHYVYYANGCPTGVATGQCYYLYASLDRGTKDPQVCSGSGGKCSKPYGSGFNMSTLCGGVCNFGLTSPNVTP